jgi:serine/threonine-protein kinase
VSEDVEALVRAARIVEAATLAREHGDWKTASRLFERACDWASSAEAALAAGEPERALSVAALGGAEDTARRALDQLVASGRGDLARVGDTLRQQGQHAWAARVYEQAGATDRAAEAWERAGERVEAARILEGAGLDGAVRAARVLEAGLRQEDGRGDLLLALGSLLLRSGKPTAALRTLQRVPDDAREKTEALRLSLRALLELGMRDGAAEVQAILAARGEAEEIAERPAPKAQGGAVRPRLYGRYEIVREVSSTATARLLECVDVLRGSRVALKIFSAAADATKGSGRDALAHFVREARVLGQLAHPNIVPLHEVLEQGPALVLEWMPGGTLEERMATDALTPRRAADIAAAILSALGEAHRVGVVHRDLKPANILFDAGGTARLSDFGVAHLGDLSVTATAGSFGSLAYMSPEQRAGRPATVRSDIFGLGTILREMLTGTRSRPLGTEPVPPLSAVHHHLDERHDALLRSFLAEVPDARPANAFEARRALLAIPWPDDHDPLRARPTPSAPRSVHPAAARLDEPLELGAFAVDRWLERPVARLPLTSRRLQQAAIYARNASRLLQPILRVDREGEALWLGAPRGVPLSRPLSPDELTAVGGVLTALHREGFVHGAIDRTTVVLGPDGIELLFPPGDAEADLTAQDDLAALALLG